VEEKDKDEKENGKEEKKGKEEQRSTVQGKMGGESPRISPEPTEKDATTSLTVLSIPIKKKWKRQRKTPLYIRKRKITRIRQGRHQTPTKIPILN